MCLLARSIDCGICDQSAVPPDIPEPPGVLCTDLEASYNPWMVRIDDPTISGGKLELARSLNCELVTADRRILAYPDVRSIAAG
jgi:hypothetical protein